MLTRASKRGKQRSKLLHPQAQYSLRTPIDETAENTTPMMILRKYMARVAITTLLLPWLANAGTLGSAQTLTENGLDFSTDQDALALARGLLDLPRNAGLDDILTLLPSGKIQCKKIAALEVQCDLSPAENPSSAKPVSTVTILRSEATSQIDLIDATVLISTANRCISFLDLHTQLRKDYRFARTHSIKGSGAQPMSANFMSPPWRKTGVLGLTANANSCVSIISFLTR